MIQLIKQIDFFRDRDIKDHDLNEISNCLKYEYHRKNNIVFDYGKTPALLVFTVCFSIGTTGEKFYIILSGQVSVQIPIKRKKISPEEQLLNEQ